MTGNGATLARRVRSIANRRNHTFLALTSYSSCLAAMLISANSSRPALQPSTSAATTHHIDTIIPRAPRSLRFRTPRSVSLA
jgi:hypothetical protein